MRYWEEWVSARFFRKWIQGCLNGSRASILINGSPAKEFDIGKGLRQGDPMSPFLFILAMEGLHATIDHAIAKGLYVPATIGNANRPLSNLFYADDAIFIGEWSHDNIYNLLCILNCFFIASGLKVNVHESKLLGVNVDENEIAERSQVLGCGVANLPMTYLGVPIGCNMGRANVWGPIVKKFNSKLSQWKVKLLSIGGRLTLIKSVLRSLPTYYMSLYMMPTTIANKLESLRNQFFIGSNTQAKKLTWINWKQCMASKAMGGLGMGSIQAFNVALLYKWTWRFRNNKNELWAQVISDIHGSKGELDDNNVRVSGWSPWVSIINVIKRMKDKGIDLMQLSTRKVGNGLSTSFWCDSWHGQEPLKCKFPRIYALENHKECNVASRIKCMDWSSCLIRLPRGGREAHQFEELKGWMAGVVLSNRADKWEWSPDHKGFTVASARHYIDDRILPSNGTTTRWNKWIPIKVNVFNWRLCLDRLSTLVNVDKKGIDVDSTLCHICGDLQESTNHLFFSCSLAKHMWSNMAKCCNMDIPVWSSYADYSMWLFSLSCIKEVRRLLEAIVCSILWSVWQFRNTTIFSRQKPKKLFVWDVMMFNSYTWISSRNPRLGCSWNDWVDNPVVNSKFM